MQAKRTEAEKLLMRVSRDVQRSYDRFKELRISDSAIRPGLTTILISGQTMLDIVKWRKKLETDRLRRYNVKHGQLDVP